MLNIAQRYILKQILGSTLIISVVISFAIWMTQALRFIDVVINKGLPLTTFLKLTLYLIPDIFAIILPIGFFIAVVFTYNKMEKDHELIIFRSVGVSSLSLAQPVIIVGSIITIFLFYMNLHLMPQTLRKFKDQEHVIRNQASAVLIQDGQFTNMKGLTLYVNIQKPGGVLEGILVHDARNVSKQSTLIAEKGYLNKTPKGLQLVMEKGSRQHHVEDSNKPETVYFEEYTVNLTKEAQIVKRRNRKPYEMTLFELFNPFKKNESDILKMRAEGHKRITTPILAFIFGIVGVAVMLYGEFSRRRRLKRVFVAVGVVLVVQLSALAFINLSDRFEFLIPSLYVLLAGISIMALLVLALNIRFSRLFPKREVV